MEPLEQMASYVSVNVPSGKQKAMEVLDLRGRRSSAKERSVLADPSGRRARVVKRLGQVIALVFLIWLIGLVLAGLDILPPHRLPLGRELFAQPAPLQAPDQGAAADPVSSGRADPRTGAGAAVPAHRTSTHQSGSPRHAQTSSAQVRSHGVTTGKRSTSHATTVRAPTTRTRHTGSATTPSSTSNPLAPNGTKPVQITRPAAPLARKIATDGNALVR